MPGSFSLITSWDKVYLTASDRRLGSGWPGVGQRLGSGWVVVGRGLDRGWAVVGQWLGSGWPGGWTEVGQWLGGTYIKGVLTCFTHPTHSSPPQHTHTHHTQFKKHIGIYYNVLCSLLTLELKFEVRSLLRRVFVLIGCEFNIASDDEIRSFSVPS